MEIVKPARPLNFSEALTAFGNRVFQFQGRSRRSEYWWTMLVFYGGGILLTPYLTVLGCWLLGLVTIPLTFRRLHDTGRSGWWWGVGIILRLAFLPMVIADVVGMVVAASNGIDVNPLVLVGTLLGKYVLF